jgi:hypothetical protein
MVSARVFDGRRLERRGPACAECSLVGWRGPCPGVDGAPARLEPRPPTGAPLSRTASAGALGRLSQGRAPVGARNSTALVRRGTARSASCHERPQVGKAGLARLAPTVQSVSWQEAPCPEPAGAARGGGRSANGGRPAGSRRSPRRAVRSGRGAGDPGDVRGRRLGGCLDARLLDA